MSIYKRINVRKGFVVFTILLISILLTSGIYAYVSHKASEVNVQFRGEVTTAQRAFDLLSTSITNKAQSVAQTCGTEIIDFSADTTIIETNDGGTSFGHDGSQIIVTVFGQEMTVTNALNALSTYLTVNTQAHVGCIDVSSISTSTIPSTPLSPVTAPSTTDARPIIDDFDNNVLN